MHTGNGFMAHPLGACRAQCCGGQPQRTLPLWRTMQLLLRQGPAGQRQGRPRPWHVPAFQDQAPGGC